jgi:Na+/melibiose symporter-like transporter
MKNEGGDADNLLDKKVENIPRDGLKLIHVGAYSIGHLCNDLCASMWFVYLTWYIKNVVGLNDMVTAGSILSGQLADGFMTPIVGVLSDKYDTRWGKRTPWYFFGTLLVIPTFLGIFSYPSFINTCDTKEDCEYMPTRQAIWYITMPGVFNLGWAAV